MAKTVVRDLMSDRVLTMSPGDALTELRDLMHSRSVRHVPIVNDRHELVGLVSHRDLLRNTLLDYPRLSGYAQDVLLSELRVEEIMTRELHVVEPDTDVTEAARLMLERKYGCLPVVQGGELVGILTETDFVRLHTTDSDPS